MEVFVWDDRFLTGCPTVDEQHRNLFDLVNRVGALLLTATPADAADAAAVAAVFRELEAYAASHFAEEERLMREAGVPAEYFAHHVHGHASFVEQVKLMWAQHASLGAPAEMLHGFLLAWLTYHILGEDQAMARLLLRRQAGDGAPKPQEMARRGERSSAALLHALRTLYGVLSQLNRDLAAANRGLEEKVTARTQELAAANRQLQAEQAELVELLSKVDEAQSHLVQSEKMASIGQLAAGVAHEINNPVGFVNSNLTTLEHYIPDLLRLAELGTATAEGRALGKQIDFEYLKGDLGDLLLESRNGLERVRRIVADLKDFSRVGQVEWQDADLLAGLESTLNVARHDLRYKADIVRELQPLPPVRCVQAQINQVLLNLLVNAAQAIQTRGAITLRSGVEGRFVWIEVADNGCGMDDDTRRHMFEPFFTTKPVGTGTGLGLSLSYDIVVTRHGGRFEVTSAPGQGTALRFWLPIAGPDPPPAQ